MRQAPDQDTNRMKRRLCAILVITIAGLLLSLFSGLFGAMHPWPLEFDSGRTALERRALWNRIDSNSDAVQNQMRFSGFYRGFGHDLIITRPDVEQRVTVFDHRAGWPFRVLQGREIVTISYSTRGGLPNIERELESAVEYKAEQLLHAPQTLNAGQTGKVAISMQPIGLSPAPAQLIPYDPIWSGLVLNLLTLYVMLIVLSLLRRLTLNLWRRIRGKCPGCAYDLRGTSHTHCPECGKTIDHRASTVAHRP
ncbi:MAG: hypothetical protein O7G85_15805 [Planctomycetota bacterium]|nr:hypothetical protein [Planctomycetota bacterium]